MLEVTTACVEPAAHLFLRRFAPPVRSTRLLGPHFWHNGGHALELPAWWPSYLDSIRQIPQAQSASPLPAAAGVQPNQATTERNRPRRRTRPAAKHATASKIQHGSRAFSLSLRSPSPSQASLQEANVETQNWYQHDVDQFTRGLQQDRQEPDESVNAEYLQPWDTALASQQVPSEPVDPQVEHLQNLLARDPKPELAKARRDKVWNVWITLPDQQRFASKVLRKLSDSSDVTQLDRAMQAYSIIPLEDRISADYETAIAIAITRHRYAQAFQICDDSVGHGMEFQPALTLLVCCLRQRLWKTAARAWRVYFNNRDHRQVDWSTLDNDPDLVTLSSGLLSRLNAPDLILATDIPLLKGLAVVLVTRLTASSRAMGLITQQGILQIFDFCRSLDILKPRHYTGALYTLCNDLKARLRVDLALIIYRSFKLHVPVASQGVFFGLLHLCALANSKPETFEYLMKEYRDAHNPERKAYNMVMMAMARQANVAEVETYFKEFISISPHALDMTILSPRIYVHAIRGDAIKAQNAFDEIEPVYGMQPDTLCWNTLIYAYSRSNEPQKVFEVFDQMMARGVEPDAYTFGTLTGVASNSGDTSRTLSLLEIASQYQIPRTGELLASVVHSLCLNHQTDEAWNFAEQATQAGVHGSPVRMWNTLLRHYAFLTDARAVNGIQERMRKLEVKPDDMTYAAVMTALVRKGKTGEALRLVRSLHFSGKHPATAFHYSILVHGFAMEGNRDMALSIYKEMEERFPRVSPSARLAMLYTQLDKDFDLAAGNTARTHNKAQLQLGCAAAMAKDLLIQTSVADIVLKDPQPGFRRRNLLGAFPSISVEALIDSLMSDAQSSNAQSLLRSLEATPLKSMAASQSRSESIELLSRRLSIAVQQQNWGAVDSIWNTIFSLAIERGIASAAPSEFLTELRCFRGLDQPFLKVAQKYRSLLDKYSLKILPAQRFSLSKPLSRYIQALEQQADVSSTINSLVENLQACGFELSSKNWNSYVQALCKSESYIDHVAALEVFDAKFRSNIPPYTYLFSGTWASPARIVKGHRADVAKRKLTEQLNPWKLIPTYFTVVYLKSALMKYPPDNSAAAVDLHAKAPESYEYVRRLPYKADRVQGVLLRGAKPYGDPVRRTRALRSSDLGGVVGSKASLDELEKSPGGKHIERVGLIDQRWKDINLERLVANDYIGDPAHVSKPTATSISIANLRKPVLSVLPRRGASRSTSANSVIVEQVSQDIKPVEQDLKLALTALRLSRLTDQETEEPKLIRRKRSRVTLYPPIRESRQRSKTPGVALLNRLLPSRSPGRQHDSRRRELRLRRRQSILSRAQTRKHSMEKLKVRAAAMRLLQMLPRFRDLTFQARIAQKRGDLTRAQLFYDWAYNPVFKWSTTIKTPADRRKIYGTLAQYAPSIRRSDKFELTMIQKLRSNPGAVMFEEMTAGGPQNQKPAIPRLIKGENVSETEDMQDPKVPSLQSRHGAVVVTGRSVATGHGAAHMTQEEQEPDRMQSHTQFVQKNSWGSSLDGAFDLPLARHGVQKQDTISATKPKQAFIGEGPAQEPSTTEAEAFISDFEGSPQPANIGIASANQDWSPFSSTKIEKTFVEEESVPTTTGVEIGNDPLVAERDQQTDFGGSPRERRSEIEPRPGTRPWTPTSTTLPKHAPSRNPLAQVEVGNHMSSAFEAQHDFWSASMSEKFSLPDVMHFTAPSTGADLNHWAWKERQTSRDDDSTKIKGFDISTMRQDRPTPDQAHSTLAKDSTVREQEVGASEQTATAKLTESQRQKPGAATARDHRRSDATEAAVKAQSAIMQEADDPHEALRQALAGVKVRKVEGQVNDGERTGVKGKKVVRSKVQIKAPERPEAKGKTKSKGQVGKEEGKK